MMTYREYEKYYREEKLKLPIVKVLHLYLDYDDIIRDVANAFGLGVEKDMDIINDIQKIGFMQYCLPENIDVIYDFQDKHIEHMKQAVHNKGYMHDCISAHFHDLYDDKIAKINREHDIYNITHFDEIFMKMVGLTDLVTPFPDNQYIYESIRQQHVSFNEKSKRLISLSPYEHRLS